MYAIAYASYVQGVRAMFAASRLVGSLIVVLAAGVVAGPLLARGAVGKGLVGLLLALGVPVLAEATIRRRRKAQPDASASVAPNARRRAVKWAIVAFGLLAFFVWAVGEPARDVRSTRREIHPGMTLSQVLGAAQGVTLISGYAGEFEEGKPPPPELFASQRSQGHFSFRYGDQGYGELTPKDLDGVLAAHPEIRTPEKLRLTFLSSVGIPATTLLWVHFDAQGHVVRVSDIGFQD